MLSVEKISWIERAAPGINQPLQKKEHPSQEGRFCQNCLKWHSQDQWGSLLEVCSSCQYHHPISRKKRVAMLLDEIYHEIGSDYVGKDFLSFVDSMPYLQRLHHACQKTDETEALSVYFGRMGAHRVVLSVFDFDFIGGSMSAAVGQRFIAAVEYALKHRYPLICQAQSGGARMQEGVHSLIQMIRTSAALAQLSEQQIPYLVTMISPCMGGVSASLANLGDLILAEPNALVGFAGPRVIAQLTGGQLPPGFQTSEFVKDCGFIDQIVHRKDLKKSLEKWLDRFHFYMDEL